jgi:type IX secretion system PorP/SprF family membrane protein
MMGANNDLRVILNHRRQWTGIADGYQTYSFTGMYPLVIQSGQQKLGIGLHGFQDQEGAFKTIDGKLSVSYSIQLAENNYLSAGVNGGYIQRSLNTKDLTFDNQYNTSTGQYDGSRPTGEGEALTEQNGFGDVGAGLMWHMAQPYSPGDNSVGAFAGIAGYHLNTPNESFIDNPEGQRPMRFSYLLGGRVMAGNFGFTPHVRLITQNGPEELAGGVHLHYVRENIGKITAGAVYKRRDGVGAIVGYSHDYFTVGYSYDMTVSRLNTLADGANAHEISLSFKLQQAEGFGAYPYPEF